ncbi:MAG TPA: Mrp/NBP35 family ATP-binding protein [Acidimicrobiales bacterium]|nr:Mrp/NBP35 family ATP-binding protein [Acidimicrobiales bacterium]
MGDDGMPRPPGGSDGEATRSPAGPAVQGAAPGPRGAAAADSPLLEALRGVVDPELGGDIVELGMVRSATVEAGRAVVEVALTVAGCPLRGQLRRDVERHAIAVPGVREVEVVTGVMGPEERATLMERARRKAQERAVTTDLPPTARVLAVMSGKGGVGKSSVTVNLAVALARRGLSVGLLDADIWGFSVPRMLGVEGPLPVRAGKMVPIERPVGDGVVKVVSMGFLSGEDDAIMWRGLVLNRAVQHFLEDVAWGALDYLLVDMPPGTGDVQMGLARMLPRTELLVVTTPALAAQKVAGRAADMARKGNLRVAGVVENMAGFTCEHGSRHALFGVGGGERLAAEIGVPLVGSIPLDPGVAAGGDAGAPPALDPASPLAGIFADLAERIATEVAPVLEMSSCSARLLRGVEAALRRPAS